MFLGLIQFCIDIHFLGDYSHNLLNARVFLISDDKCKTPEVYGNKIDSSMLCAGTLRGGIDSCQVCMIINAKTSNARFLYLYDCLQGYKCDIEFVFDYSKGDPDYSFGISLEVLILGMGDTTLFRFDMIPILFLSVSLIPILIPILIISYWSFFKIKMLLHLQANHMTDTGHLSCAQKSSGFCRNTIK